MAVADGEFGRRNARLRIDIIETAEVDRGIAPGLRGGPAAVRRHRDPKPLEIQIELHQRLARQIDRSPSVERAVAERAGEAVDHHDRTIEPDFRLGRQRCLQQAGGIELEFGRDVLPFDRRRGRRRLDLEFQRLPAAARIACYPDLAIGIDRDVGVDGLDLVLDAVAQVGKHDRAAGDADMLDRQRTASGRRSRLRWRIGLALALQRHVHHRAHDHQFGDLGLAGPDAGQGDIGLDAARGEAVVDVALLRVLQHDVGQRKVERRPQADFGAAIDGERVAGLALDPFLDLRRQEPRGDADHQQQCDDDDDGPEGGAGDFQCSHVDIPDRATGINSAVPKTHATDQASLSRKGTGPKEAKNNPRVL